MSFLEQVLFHRHTFSLFEQMLSILLELPCTMPAKEYKAILPSAGMDLTSFGFVSRIDIESVSQIREMLSISFHSSSPDTLPDALMSQMHKEQSLQIPSFSQEDLSAFYVSCAQRIENETGSVQLAKSVLECGIENKVSGEIEEMLQKLTLFESWSTHGSPFWNWTTSAFFELTVQQRLEHIFAATDQEGILNRMETFLFPLCSQLPKEDKATLRDTLFLYALQRNAKLFKELVTTECIHNALFDASASGFSEFLSTLVVAIETVDRVTDWDTVYDAIELLSKQDGLQSAHASEMTRQLEDLMEDCYLGALLEKYQTNLSYKQLTNMSTTESHRLVQSILGYAMRSGGKWSDMQWDELLSDLMSMGLRMSHLSESAFDMDTLKQDYFRTLLRASQFSLADSYMEHSMDPQMAEEIAWKVGREVLCSITDLDNIESIEEARRCFDLFPSSQRARDEIAKLKALNAIRLDFSVALLPMEMEQFQSKSELVEGVLDNSDKHYKKRSAFLSLSQELQFSEVEFFEAWRLLCQTALRHKDLLTAKEFLSDLRERDMVQSWTLARDVVAMDKGLAYLSAPEKRDLWAFIIRHCDTGLQDCIEEMRTDSSLDVSDEADDVQLEWGGSNQQLSCHDDAYLYLADAVYRQQLKSQELSHSEQKCNAYDFVAGALASVNNTTSNSAEFLRALLEASPNEIITMLKESPQFLHQGKQKAQEIDTFEQHLSTLQEREKLQSSCRRIRSILPAFESELFCGKDAIEYRTRIIRELAKYAGELLYAKEGLIRTVREEDHGWQDVLSVALEEGEIYDMDLWSLRLHFVITLGDLIDRNAPAIEEAVLSVEDRLMSNKAMYVEEIVKTSWPEAGNPFGVAFILRICARCLEASESPSETGLLLEYAAVIIELADDCGDMDFRIPIFAVLQCAVFEMFEWHYDWNPGTSEVQNVYASINSTNYIKIVDLYRMLEEHASNVLDAQDRVSSSKMCLAFSVKQLLHGDSGGSVESKGFWTGIFTQLGFPDTKALLNFAILGDAEILQERLVALDKKTWNEIQSWDGSTVPEEKRVTILKLMLEEGIEKFKQDSSDSYSSELEKWRAELKRMRRLHATQDLTDLGVQISGDSFVENVKNVVRKMVLSDNGYALVFETVRSFAERSEEECQPPVIAKYISDTLLDWTVECITKQDSGFYRILVSLDDAGHPDERQLLQQEIWQRSITTLKQFSEVREVQTGHVVKDLIAVINETIWKGRLWEIAQEDRWLLFSWTVLSELISLADTYQMTHTKKIESFSSRSAVDKLLEFSLPSASTTDMCTLLDVLSSAQELLGTGITEYWLSSHYLSTFKQAMECSRPLDVLRYLCERRVEEKSWAALAESDAQLLFRNFRQISKNLWICLGMLLPFASIQQESLVNVRTIDGDVSTLAILLQTHANVQFDSLIGEKTWLMSLLQNCPPHPRLTKNWKPLELTTGGMPPPPHGDDHDVEKDVSMSLSESGDGWDIDDTIILEEQTTTEKELEQQIEAGASEGWSDVDELDTVLQTEPISSAKECKHGPC